MIIALSFLLVMAHEDLKSLENFEEEVRLSR
jgi:hypothetical protein